MTPPTKPPQRRVPARRPNRHELTPAALTLLMTHAQNLSRSKPRQSETILKLARAQVAITKALEPFEQARNDLLATVPPVPPPNADEAYVREYSRAKDECDEKFREIYLKGKFAVDLPEPIGGAELQHFAEPVNPIDLAALHPYIVNLDQAGVEKGAEN
jgi:hypothetical protein